VVVSSQHSQVLDDWRDEAEQRLAAVEELQVSRCSPLLGLKLASDTDGIEKKRIPTAHVGWGLEQRRTENETGGTW
jgi:hypothetical protein